MKMCSNYKKGVDCEVYNKYGKYGCPPNSNGKCEIEEEELCCYHSSRPYVKENINKARERVAKIVNSKLCLELTDHQRKMLSDEIMHCAMLCSLDAVKEVSNYIASNKK